MKTVKQAADFSGVSVRTLHHYDAIGLLKPTMVTKAGYRLYDDAAMSRLQSILLFRELRFSLKEIKEFLDKPGFDPKAALKEQITLLQMEYQRLGELIAYARKIEREGGNHMAFEAFDKAEIEQYKKEAKERWGSCEAYRESEQKSPTEQVHRGMMAQFSLLGEMKQPDPASDVMQQWVRQLQDYISEHYYRCTVKILASLGQMYVEDERFAANIDAAGGKGTASLASEAIKIYCENQK